MITMMPEPAHAPYLAMLAPLVVVVLAAVARHYRRRSARAVARFFGAGR